MISERNKKISVHSFIHRKKSRKFPL